MYRRRTMLESEKGRNYEIRMNPNFTSLIGVEKPFGEEGEETTAVRKARTLRTQKYIDKLSAEVISPNLITPPNCRYMERFNEGTIVLIEQPPAARTICVDIAMGGYIETLKDQGKLVEYGYENFLKENSRPFYFTLAFPFMIFMFAINNNHEILEGRVACRTRQISGLADMLFKVPLNNISRGDHVCWPQGFYAKRASVYSATMLGIKAWWSSIFNSDFSYNVNEYKEKGFTGLGNYLEWNYMTKINPLFIYNTKWIRLRKLGPTLEEMIEGHGFTSMKTLTFNRFQKLFKQPTPTGELVKPHKRARKLKPLFYDICQSAFLSPNILVNVGDKFKYSRRRKRYGHVESFMGLMGSSRPSHIAIDVEGRIVKMKLTNKVKRYISRKVNYYRKETKTTIDGVEIRKGDIISFKINDVKTFKKVDYIQKTIDGQIEVKAREFYLASSMKELEKIDVDNIELHGIKLVKGKEYLVLRDSARTSLYQYGSVGCYRDAGVDENGIYFEFENVSSYGTNRFRDNTRFKRVYEKDDFPILMDKVFFIGRKLMYVYQNSKEQEPAWLSPYGVIVNKETGISSADWEYVKNLVEDDTFHVKGALSEITFKIGDLVVVSDWNEPLNMLDIKKIIAFEINDDNKEISFVLEDKNGQKTKHVYVRSTLIKNGTVRKVSTSIGDFKIGTKLISMSDDFPGFPSGSVNIVVAFITDTGIDEPLVLCSNCQTLWLNDIEGNFTKVSKESEQWNTLDHSDFDIEDIKVQPGDIVNGMNDYTSDYGFALAFEVGYFQLCAYMIDHFMKYPERYELDRWFRDDCIFDCIINPRYPESEMSISNKDNMICGWPTFQGTIMQTGDEASVMLFPPKYGRIINV